MIKKHLENFQTKITPDYEKINQTLEFINREFPEFVEEFKTFKENAEKLDQSISDFLVKIWLS